jgi:hypothetical protein
MFPLTELIKALFFVGVMRLHYMHHPNFKSLISKRDDTTSFVHVQGCHLSPNKHCTQLSLGKGKGKAIPLLAWTGPEGSRRLRLPDFKTIGTYAPAAFNPQELFLVLISVRS